METIEIYGHTIRLTTDEDSNQLKPALCDLCEATGLLHLKEQDQINRLLDLLLSGKHKEALKITCYGSDLNVPKVTFRSSFVPFSYFFCHYLALIFAISFD